MLHVHAYIILIIISVTIHPAFIMPYRKVRSDQIAEKKETP